MNPYERFLNGKDPMKVLASTHKQLVKLTSGLSARQLARRPAPGKWSIREIVAHLADGEMVAAARCRWIAFEENPTLMPYDQDKWTSGREREKEPLAETLERFRAVRQSQLRLFRNTPAKDFARTGKHLERGTQQLRDYPPLCAGHDLNHLGQIAALRAELVGRKP